MKRDNDKISKSLKKKEDLKKASVINALHQEELCWLGNVPINKISQLRERGELADLRDPISKDVKDIEEASDEEFVDVANQASYNIYNALKKHSAEIQDLKTTFRDRYNLDIKYFVVSGAIAISSALFQPIASATGILSTLSGIVPSTFKTLTDYNEERARLRELQKKPVALLFEVKKPEKE